MRNRWALLLACVCFAAGAQQYQTARPGYRFEFPRDYFSHEDYQTEWWYYTGNLRASDGRRFGFELTFFRQGVSQSANGNGWHVNDLWMAHMALSDIRGQRFYHEERLNRAGPGIAGAQADSGLIWNGNWQARKGMQGEQLRGIGKEFAFQLELVPLKQPVIQGKNGISQKAEGAGHASHYLSETRLATSGSISVDGHTYRVEGSSWMDHEFFTGSMAASETGWDWLGIQLQDGTELMLYRLRKQDGGIDRYSSGSYVNRDGRSEVLEAGDFDMEPAKDKWTGAVTGASYPVRWHVSIPRLKLQLDISTPLRDQEMTSRFGPSYWEGAVDASGTRDGNSIRAVGYLEMTGYAQGQSPLSPR